MSPASVDGIKDTKPKAGKDNDGADFNIDDLFSEDNNKQTTSQDSKLSRIQATDLIDGYMFHATNTIALAPPAPSDEPPPPVQPFSIGNSDNKNKPTINVVSSKESENDNDDSKGKKDKDKGKKEEEPDDDWSEENDVQVRALHAASHFA